MGFKKLWIKTITTESLSIIQRIQPKSSNKHTFRLSSLTTALSTKLQKKKVVLGNVKHSGDEKDISLSKSSSGNSVYSNVNSLSGDDKDVGITGMNSGSHLGSAVTTPKTKRVNTGVGFGSSLSSPNFYMEDDKIVFPFRLPISLDKKWIDPKIIKTPVEVSVKKSFTLDINLSAVESKSATAKTQESMIKTALLAREKGIVINNNLKIQGMRSDWAVIIKKILMDMPKDMIITTVSEFGKIKSIKIQLIGMWQKAVVEFAELDQADLLVSKWSFLIGKNFVCIAKTVENLLLFTLPVETMAYDLGTLLDRAGKKTCVINRSLETGNRICCAVVNFKFNNDLESAFHTELILGSIKLSWARIDLVWCEKCGKFGHSAMEYNASVASSPKLSRTFKRVVSNRHHLQLAKLYDKKSVLIFHPTAFGGKSWAQVVTLVGPSGGFCFSFGSSSSLHFSGVSDSDSSFPLTSANTSFLSSLSFSMSNLVWKAVTCNVRGINNPAKQKDISGYLGAGVTIIMDVSLVKHVYKVSEVFVLGLYVSTTLEKRLAHSHNINLMVAETLNGSTFVVLSGNFNKNNSGYSASFKKCLDLGLFDSLHSFSLHRLSIWFNLRGIQKCIDFILVNDGLHSLSFNQKVYCPAEFFDSDYLVVSADIGLEGFLNSQLNSVCKQAMKKKWKYKVSGVSDEVWKKFRDALLAAFSKSAGNFEYHTTEGNINRMWTLLCQMVHFAAEATLMKIWSRDSELVKTSASSRFHKLELLVDLNFDQAVEFKSSLDNGHDRVLIRVAIDKHIEAFADNKGQMIRSVLEKLFRKVMLDHLIDNGDLVLESDLVKGRSNLQCLLVGKYNFLLLIMSVIVHFLHCDKSVLVLLLHLLNLCLLCESVPDAWREAWVSMIPKPYEWEGVLTNTRPIALIKTSRKILSKILSDCILRACNTHNVLCRDNFLVLKGTSIQSLIFVVESVVENALKKSRKLWLRIKMCERFVRFFGSIHNGCKNKVMTDFGLSKGYKVDSKFVARTYKVELNTGLTSYLAAGAFVDNTIWVGNCCTVTQNILNIASEFFKLMDISINTEKTVAISINPRTSNTFLEVSKSSILITKSGEANSDVKFFSSMVLCKAIMNKQFSYLVLAVLQSIMEYRTQFSFVSRSICEKWDYIIRKGLKSKANLFRDFSNEVVHHSSFYNLKPFEQVLGWVFWNSLQFPVKLMINSMNNFLAGVAKNFLCNGISLANSLLNAFCFKRGFSVLDVLGQTMYLWICRSLKHFGIIFNGGLVKSSSFAFEFSSKLDVSDMDHFGFVHSSLKDASLPMILVYTDGSVKGFGTSNAVRRTAAYFSDLSLHIGVEVHDMLSSTLAEMQAVVLAFECIPASLDACQAKLSNLVKYKNISVTWLKVKGHSGILDNEHANWLADLVTSSRLVLSANVKENFLMADGKIISDNARCFTRLTNNTVRRFQWEFGSGLSVVDPLRVGNINWVCIALVWHPDSHMSTGYISRTTTSLHTYLMKALHRKLPIAVKKHLYDQSYPSVFCVRCGESLASFVSNGGLYTSLCKCLVFEDWLAEAKVSFVNTKLAMSNLVKFVWNRSLCNIVRGLPAKVSGGVAYLLGIERGYVTNFGLSISHLFFAGAVSEITVNIVA
ncbi:hypothetical protein G9A89_010976 [Geosiphon pyriformis]|nr:hypothetical protein G9A89_010976 [Geosiphon pyriformis]